MIKKVLQIIGTLKVGGAENVAMNYQRYIDKNRFQCDYLVFGDSIGEYENEAKELGSKVFHISQPSRGYFKFYMNVKKICKTEKYDIVHSHTLLNNGIVLAAAKKAGVNIRISHSHSTCTNRRDTIEYRIYERIMRKLIIKNATDIVACGKEAAVFLYGNNEFKKRGSVINNGIDIDKYTFNINLRERYRCEMGLSNKIVIGHVGHLLPVKNHSFLLDVFNEILHLNSEAVLLIIGDGVLRGQIEDKAIQLGIKDKVIFTGVRFDIAGLLQAMDAFVFPSIYEGLPVSLVEAQVSGLVCVVSKNITREVALTPNINFLSLDESADVWANKILNSINGFKRGRVSIENLNDQFNVKNIVAKLEGIYES